MLKDFWLIVLATVIMLLVGFILTSIGAAIMAVTGWLLTLVTSLTFPQATLVAGVTGSVITYLSQRELDTTTLESVLIVLILTPLISLSFMAVAWGLDRFSPLDFWQATLLATGIGLVVLYGFLHRIVGFPLPEDEGDWEEEEWDEEDWEDEDEDAFVPPPLYRHRPTLRKDPIQEMDEDSKWANVGRNDPCPCGSGKKYKYCHGRKSKSR